MLSWFRNYLVIMSGDMKPTAASKKVSTITVYDAKTKLIAYSGSFNDVQYILNEFGSVYVIQGDGKVCNFNSAKFC